MTKVQLTLNVTLLATGGKTSFLPMSGMVSATTPSPRDSSNGVDSVLPRRSQMGRRPKITSRPAVAMYEYSIVVPLSIVLFINPL